MERWVQSKSYPTYEVSNEGRIRNGKTGRVLKTNVNARGYEQVCLRKDKKQYTAAVHRVVADAFYEGNYPELDVNHIDGNKTNNSIGNLEWCTRKENYDHAIRSGLKQPPRRTKVRIVETGVVYDSLSACSQAIGGDRCQIHRCLIGKEKTCKGYHFESAD